MAKPASDRIAKLQAQEKTLAAKRAKLEAVEKAKAAQLKKRRTFIVGEAVLDAIESDTDLSERIRGVLAASVERKVDREVIADLLKG
jgi:hypothetical protein